MLLTSIISVFMRSEGIRIFTASEYSHIKRIMAGNDEIKTRYRSGRLRDLSGMSSAIALRPAPAGLWRWKDRSSTEQRWVLKIEVALKHQIRFKEKEAMINDAENFSGA